jgi:class 3 adenylate cyclase
MRASVTSTRVNRCFAFVDMCGFTDFVDAHGDAAGVAELGRLRSTVREVAPLCGVRVDKWLGDGVMLVGVESEPVVRAVLSIEQRLRKSSRLPLRTGVAAGDVLILEGDDYLGRAVNLAARLCDLAGPHEILAASGTVDMPSWVAATPAVAMDVKGFAEPIMVAALSVRAGRGWLRRTG